MLCMQTFCCKKTITPFFKLQQQNVPLTERWKRKKNQAVTYFFKEFSFRLLLHSPTPHMEARNCSLVSSVCALQMSHVLFSSRKEKRCDCMENICEITEKGTFAGKMELKR